MKQKTQIGLVIMVFLLSGCQFFQSAEREDCNKILSKAQMTEILFDLYLTEGFLSERQGHLSQPQDSVAIFFDGVLEKHQIDFQTFQEALNCYLLHPMDMEVIHETLLTRLKVERTRLQAESYRLSKEARRPAGYVWLSLKAQPEMVDTLYQYSVRRLVPEMYLWPQ